MDLRVTAAPVPKPKIAAKTVVRSGLLQLASVELERAIQQELSENPALAVTEAGCCEICGSVLAGSSCPQCRGWTERTVQRAFDEEDTYRVAADRAEDHWDPFSTVAAPWSFREHLLWQLSPQLSDADLEIASLLLENLDHHGLLDCEIDSIASAVGVRVNRVETVRSAIQRQDPVGIASRTVEESLLLQLDVLEGDRQLVALSRRLIQDYWESLCKGKLGRIAGELRVGEEDVARARDFIKSNLDPYPIHACIQSHAPAQQPVDAAYLRPDVVIAVRGQEGNEEFEIGFPEERRFRLALDRGYEAASETLDSRVAKEDDEASEHVRQSVERGRLFISAWHERWQTLSRVVERLTACQREFLLKGERYLRPLTRAQLAEELDLHESTVSRAVANKYALLPGGSIVALADFFDGSLKAKSLIIEWVSHETHPLTDGELAELLAEGGVSVARRTVAKYRQALGILPSELR